MMTRRLGRVAATTVATALVAVGLSTAAMATTLDTVKERGKLACGVNQGLQGFAQ